MGLKIAGLLPHVQVFGGVRRYLELGNEFIRRGHDFTLFHPEGIPPDWLEFRGRARPFSALCEDVFDVALCSEYSILPQFEETRARKKYFYFVLENRRRERDVVRREFAFLGNSEGLCRRIERKYGVRCRRAPGGVNPSQFHPLPREASSGVFTVLCYGRIYKRRKGVRTVIRAVEGLYRRAPQLRLVFFDTRVGHDRRDPRPLVRTRVPHEFFLDLPQDRMSWLYAQADVFVSAERRAGWSNTTAEAMACCVPVVCTPSGTRDFAFDGRTALVVPLPLPVLLRRAIRRLIEDPALRARLAEAGHERILEFSWASLADRLIEIFKTDLSR
jgi:glycosyltransferase involved in cell wall biosynthesis